MLLRSAVAASGLRRRFRLRSSPEPFRLSARDSDSPLHRELHGCFEDRLDCRTFRKTSGPPATAAARFVQVLICHPMIGPPPPVVKNYLSRAFNSGDVAQNIARTMVIVLSARKMLSGTAAPVLTTCTPSCTLAYQLAAWFADSPPGALNGRLKDPEAAGCALGGRQGNSRPRAGRRGFLLGHGLWKGATGVDKRRAGGSSAVTAGSVFASWRCWPHSGRRELHRAGKLSPKTGSLFHVEEPARSGIEPAPDLLEGSVIEPAGASRTLAGIVTSRAGAIETHSRFRALPDWRTYVVRPTNPSNQMAAESTHKTIRMYFLTRGQLRRMPARFCASPASPRWHGHLITGVSSAVITANTAVCSPAWSAECGGGAPSSPGIRAGSEVELGGAFFVREV